MGNLDVVAWITGEIDNLTLGYGNPFLNVARDLHFWVAVAVLIFYAGKWALDGEFNLRPFLHFVGVYLLSSFLLQYYDKSLPWTDSSFKTLFPSMATGLANIVQDSNLDLMLQRVIDISNNLEHPLLDVWAMGMYWMIEAQMWLMGVLLLLPIGLGFIALGLGSVVTPLMIPWLMVPRLSWLFWSAIMYTVKYSLYRLWAMILTYIWAGVGIQFIDHFVYKDLGGHAYSLAQFSGVVPIALLFLNALCAWTVFCLPGFLADFFNGTASTGNSGFLSNLLPVRI